jgi:hypothetical protein
VEKIIRIGLDTAKHVYQLHGVDSAEEPVLRKKLRRMRVAIHGAVDKADGVVFCCTLSGSGADRWLEVPAWMFDRERCLDSPRLSASPFVSMNAPSMAAVGR